jgi:hypothetical protein
MPGLRERYLELGIDGSLVGLGKGKKEASYFCEPIGAEIIGWAGVDGVHYCFVEGFGEMVFAVTPSMSTAGRYVHPLAEDFESFLRLLLACGHAAALDQACGWAQPQFDAFLRENPPTEGQSAALGIISYSLGLSPMENPFAYVKELQAKFDYSLIC